MNNYWNSLTTVCLLECVLSMFPHSLSDQELFTGQFGGLDSGFNSVDSGSKRWSGNEVKLVTPRDELPNRRLSIVVYTFKNINGAYLFIVFPINRRLMPRLVSR